MDRQSEAESTGDGNAIDEYYGFSTLGNLGDSYFTQPFGPQYYRNDSNPSPIPNQSVPIGSSLAHPAGYAPSVPQIVEPTPYPLVYPQNQMDLGIMSADNYQRGYAQVGRMQGRMGNPRLYGKILGSNQPRAVSPSPSISTRTRRSRKESPKGSSPEEASSTRQRGRPRLGPRDQSATERRRTQIRLAQRAYRQRKETAISGLNERVASLEKTIEDMHKTFLDFTTKAISSGIEIGAPALARQLKSTAVKLAELAKSSADDSDGKENKKDPSSSTQAPVGERQNRRPLRASETEPVSMLGYEVTHSEEEEDEEDDNGEIAPTNPIPAAQLDSNLPPLDWTTTETVQQLQDKAPAASLHGLDAISLVKAHLSELPENIPENRFEQYLRRQGLYLDHQYFVVEVPELDEQTASLSEMQKFSENSQRSSSRGSKGARRTPQDAELDWPFESLLYSGVNFWSGNTKIPSTPDVDMEFEFNDCRYSKGKSFGPSQNLIVGSPKYGLNRGNYHRLGVEENDVKVSEEGHVECELGSH